MNSPSNKLKIHQHLNKAYPNLKPKKTFSSQQQNQNKSSINIGYAPHKYDSLFSKKKKTSIEQESSKVQGENSQSSIEVTPKVHKNTYENSHQQRSAQFVKDSSASPNKIRTNLSPNFYQSKVSNATYIPIRATLKNLVKGKTPQKIIINNKIVNKQSFLIDQPQKPNKLSHSVTIKKDEDHPPLKAIQKQNKILRQQNQLLKKQLDQIKKHLLFGHHGKKQQIISNLRDTIKKQDNQNKQLRLKLDIVNKKYAILTNLLQNKQQQIKFYNKKIDQIEMQLNYEKQMFEQKVEKMKQKINYILRCFNELQGKGERMQQEWVGFRERFKEEKEMYIHRITFLEEYIANHR